MQRLGRFRSALAITLSVAAVGAIATASAADQQQRGAAVVAAAGSGKPEFNPNSLPASSPEQLALSRHLKQVGALFYGAWWCPACSRQKTLFGKQGAQQLPYVECDKAPGDRDRCIAANIKAFPTWDL
ncbi:MAG: hypothetical protein VKM98_01705, partial [Cyanobacteriota bacterium]|nr:hypothetical protein [Cyanobacteriota bacterium]